MLVISRYQQKYLAVSFRINKARLDVVEKKRNKRSTREEVKVVEWIDMCG